MKYLMIGPTPPPLGGISVYVDRRSRMLREQGNEVSNLDFARLGVAGKFAALAGILFRPAKTSFELHAYDFSVMTALLIRPFSKEITYMDHNTLLYDHDLRGLRKAILSRFMRKAHVQFVSKAGIEFYRSRGFEFSSSEVRTAYLPPPVKDEERILASYDARTREFLETARPLIVANASQVVFIDGVDLYGLDMCANLLLKIRDTFPRAGLLFALANDKPNQGYLAEIRDILASGGAGDHFHFLSGQKELWPILKRADLFVRPTSGDGFAVSVAEAQEFGRPVVASDVVARPEGVVLFRNRDDADFANKALTVLKATFDAGRP